MKNKSMIIGLILLGIYGIVIWPQKPELITGSKSVDTRKLPVKAVVTRDVDRQSTKIVKSIAHKKEEQTNPLRKDPDFQLSHTVKARNLEIETKGYGTFPPVDLSESNPQKEHVLKALQDPKNNSGAISVVGQREAFDLGQYLDDSSSYINSAEPGRAFDAAQAGEGVMKLVREGKAGIDAKQNDTVTLTARTNGNMPISWVASDGGRFQNGLSFITLKADASGYASAEFTPTTGVINQARIRAASPVASGTLQWTVFVDLPNETITKTQ